MLNKRPTFTGVNASTGAYVSEELEAALPWLRGKLHVLRRVFSAFQFTIQQMETRWTAQYARLATEIEKRTLELNDATALLHQARAMVLVLASQPMGAGSDGGSIKAVMAGRSEPPWAKRGSALMTLPTRSSSSAATVPTASLLDRTHELNTTLGGDAGQLRQKSAFDRSAFLASSYASYRDEVAGATQSQAAASSSAQQHSVLLHRGYDQKYNDHRAGDFDHDASTGRTPSADLLASALFTPVQSRSRSHFAHASMHVPTSELLSSPTGAAPYQPAGAFADVNLTTKTAPPDVPFTQNLYAHTGSMQTPGHGPSGSACALADVSTSDANFSMWAVSPMPPANQRSAPTNANTHSDAHRLSASHATSHDAQSAADVVTHADSSVQQQQHLHIGHLSVPQASATTHASSDMLRSSTLAHSSSTLGTGLADGSSSGLIASYDASHDRRPSIYSTGSTVSVADSYTRPAFSSAAVTSAGGAAGHSTASLSHTTKRPSIITAGGGVSGIPSSSYRPSSPSSPSRAIRPPGFTEPRSPASLGLAHHHTHTPARPLSHATAASSTATRPRSPSSSYVTTGSHASYGLSGVSSSAATAPRSASVRSPTNYMASTSSTLRPSSASSIPASSGSRSPPQVRFTPSIGLRK